MRSVEKKIIVCTPDKKNIYCTIGVPKRKTKNIVVFVHGLASTELWPTMLLGSWFFRRHGFAYCRVNLYDWRPGARTLMRSDLLQHARDVDVVVEHLKQHDFNRIFAVGHSFGGLTLLQSKHDQFEALSFWDISSFITYPPKHWFRIDPSSGATYLMGGYELLMSKRYQRGIENFPNELLLISKIKVPTQICYAAGKDALLAQSSKRYFRNLKAKKELVAIPGASHSFTEEGAGELLFNQTHKWFSRKHTEQ